MWTDFDDKTLVLLALQYGLADEIEIDARGLLNRSHVERVLTDVEFEMAFGE